MLFGLLVGSVLCVLMSEDPTLSISVLAVGVYSGIAVEVEESTGSDYC